MAEYLKDIASTQLGLILERKKAENDSIYVYNRLTLRAVENDGINPNAIEPFYSKEPVLHEYLTQSGTIIMKLFFPFNPVVITRETEGYLFPSQIISIKPNKHIIPEYLCFYLSQESVAKRLLENYFWIAQRAITVDSLSNLKIKVPSLEKQRLICEYNQNYKYLCRLRKELERNEQDKMKYIFSELNKE